MVLGYFSPLPYLFKNRVLRCYFFYKTIIKYLILFCFSEKRPEQSIAAARASVMVYDDVNKKWIPAGSSHGLSKVGTVVI